MSLLNLLWGKKKNILAIFEGPDTITPLRCEPFQPMQLSGNVSDPTKQATNVKFRGMFGRTAAIYNIPRLLIGETKRLSDGRRPITGWSAVRIKMDFVTQELYIPDLPIILAEELASKTNECEMWKRKYQEANGLNITREIESKFDEKMKKKATVIADVKRIVSPYTDMFGAGMYPYGYGRSYGGGYYPQTQTQGGTTNDIT